jgi:hypothetical protein
MRGPRAAGARGAPAVGRTAPAADAARGGGAASVMRAASSGARCRLPRSSRAGTVSLLRWRSSLPWGRPGRRQGRFAQRSPVRARPRRRRAEGRAPAGPPKHPAAARQLYWRAVEPFSTAQGRSWTGDSSGPAGIKRRRARRPDGPCRGLKRRIKTPQAFSDPGSVPKGRNEGDGCYLRVARPDARRGPSTGAPSRWGVAPTRVAPATGPARHGTARRGAAPRARPFHRAAPRRLPAPGAAGGHPPRPPPPTSTGRRGTTQGGRTPCAARGAMPPEAANLAAPEWGSSTWCAAGGGGGGGGALRAATRAQGQPPRTGGGPARREARRSRRARSDRCMAGRRGQPLPRSPPRPTLSAPRPSPHPKVLDRRLL